MTDPEDDIEAVSEDENGVPVVQAASHPTRGTVLVTIRDKHPYTLWLVLSFFVSIPSFTKTSTREMPRLAKKPPNPNNPAYTQVFSICMSIRLAQDSSWIVQVRSFAFDFSAYPGYAHCRTAGHRGEREIPVVRSDAETSGARTWIFELKDE